MTGGVLEAHKRMKMGHLCPWQGGHKVDDGGRNYTSREQKLTETSIQTWALEEARRRLEAEGILAEPVTKA